MKVRTFLASASFLLLTLPGCTTGDSASSEEADLVTEPSLTFGTWKSPVCEIVGDGTFQLRTYRIAANGVFADWARFSASTCAQSSQLYTIRMGGSSKIDRLSKVASPAFDIRVLIDERAIVPNSQKGVDRLEAECPAVAWKTGVEVGVTEQGCGSLVPQNADCPIEYDLMRLSGTKLYFGDRSHPLCTVATRPTKLSVWSVKFDHVL